MSQKVRRMRLDRKLTTGTAINMISVRKNENTQIKLENNSNKKL